MKTSITCLTLAFISLLVFASCSKDAVPDVPSSSSLPPTEVNKIFVTGDVVDLSLNTNSIVNPAIGQELTIDRRMILSTRENGNLKWHFDHLTTGTYRINLNVGYSNNQTSYFNSIQFIVSN